VNYTTSVTLYVSEYGFLPFNSRSAIMCQTWFRSAKVERRLMW
jgi:hypothetical protein